MREDGLVSVIIPAFNEADSLRELYERTRRTLAGLRPFEFIVVDDGSTDDTMDELKSLGRKHDNIRVLSHYRNYGKSIALTQAFDTARGEVAVCMDADLQDEPEMIPRFLQKLDEGYDLVNGWRNARQDKAAKRLVSRIYNSLTLWVLKCPMHDINCGFKAMRRDVYRRLDLRGDFHRLIPAIAKGKGFKVAEVPISHSPRRYGESKYKLLRHRGLIDIFSLMTSNTTLRPMHLFCETAAMCWFVALVALASWIGVNLWTPADSLWHRLVAPLASLFSVAALFFGLLLPLIGFQIEITACRVQDTRWREGLLKEKLEFGSPAENEASKPQNKPAKTEERTRTSDKTQESPSLERVTAA